MELHTTCRTSFLNILVVPHYSLASLPTQDKSLPCLKHVEISVLTMRVTFHHELYGFLKVTGHILSQIMDQKGPNPMS